MIQFGIFAAKIIEHVFVGSTEVVDIGFSEGRTRELHMGNRPVRRHVEALPLPPCSGSGSTSTPLRTCTSLLPVLVVYHSPQRTKLSPKPRVSWITNRYPKKN
ncbi:hypothetical protein TorRG33x02_237320 [Trema orientale]|uniref:Uncharacterized protein n=1 Tax=Trema orientale TaxID=63057 RepID=A0A2P5DZG3_TREOI|nr:hypothetical protein TorRG33x02_237320 [Trema orientale]